ncbi:transcription factor WhiB [Rhodococcus rhodochrous ATCC 21198]|uniref:WhiB family transcriptional regulator n=1 Tax=Rhodococcus aetherivorans TaxID=191292 RepID=UPI0003E1D148|nr:WhiB family transcriptional regulator [Rhodococcus aetherivorans]ETT24267.1 transcription factor WhiB [Rhodococcus rhodochrous ATCC 21198]MDV6295222.1 WhiB family transcriptional regulator [Rhodococcus aetherivorans]NGP28023.1 WhiB family transcriptional regulator [Rhodococcus aetherivorans]
MNPENIPSIADHPNFREASCRQVDAETADAYWHPSRYNSAAAKMARRICQGCVILEDCRDYALKTLPEHGIWGGLDPHEIERRAGYRGQGA